MIKFFKRLFKIGEAEANAALNHLEDPIKMAEQGIRDLKDDLTDALQALAQVKSVAIRYKSEADEWQEKIAEYENKAILLLEKVQSGGLTQEEGDRLATDALYQKQLAEQKVKQLRGEQKSSEENASNLQGNIQDLKATIDQWETDLKSLKAKFELGKVTKNMSQQMSELSSNGTMAMLQRMKDKIAEQDALGKAYQEINQGNKSVDDAINEALGGKKANAALELEKLKAKLKSDHHSE